MKVYHTFYKLFKLSMKSENNRYISKENKPLAAYFSAIIYRTFKDDLNRLPPTILLEFLYYSDGGG